MLPPCVLIGVCPVVPAPDGAGYLYMFLILPQVVASTGVVGSNSTKSTRPIPPYTCCTSRKYCPGSTQNSLLPAALSRGPQPKPKPSYSVYSALISSPGTG